MKNRMKTHRLPLLLAASVLVLSLQAAMASGSYVSRPPQPPSETEIV